jgi:hypothetical protein
VLHIEQPSVAIYFKYEIYISLLQQILVFDVPAIFGDFPRQSTATQEHPFK